MCCHMDPCDWLNKFNSCYMPTVVGIVNERGLGIVMHHENSCNKGKLALNKSY